MTNHDPLNPPMFTLEWAERAGGAFTTWDIQKKLGIKQTRLKEWFKYLPPSIKAGGVGGKNYFSRTDLYKIFVFRELIDNGFARKKAAELTNEMVEKGLAYSSGILTGGYGPHEIRSSKNGVTSVIVVDFSEVRKIVDGLVA